MDLRRTSISNRDICAYPRCNNGRSNGQHLYRFPKEDNPLQKEWISKIGNPFLYKYASSTLRQMGICAEHFSPEMFKPAGSLSTRRFLKQNAVPNAVEPQECQEKQQQVQEEEKELNVKRPKLQYTQVPLTFDSNDSTMEWMSIEPQSNYPLETENLSKKSCREVRLENTNIKLRKKIKELRMQLHLFKAKCKRLKASRNHFYNKSKKKETIDEILDRHKCYNSAARTMVKLQLKRENVAYTTEEQDFAKMLFYSSASAYNTLRRNGCHLPCERAVRYWSNVNNIDTEFSDTVFNEI